MRVLVPFLLALVAAAPAQAAEPLRAGTGKADITPKLGYYLGGWTRADRTAQGQHTRLHARAMVLESGGEKVALVSIDLFMTPAGMVKHIGDRLAGRGFSEQNILMSASHTHSGPGGYANFPTLNTAAPSMDTATDPYTFYAFFNPEPADPELYNFLVDQISAAIVRADDALAPARAGWGSEEILGLTRNRSLEAHLANHGVILERGEGVESQDPGGYEHTIDPDVNVLRVDRRVRGRWLPAGAWSTFANHGTVTKSSFEFYNGDHHASAMRVFERRVRKAARVPRRHAVVNVYGNSNEGDMSAGLDRHGPAASDFVGRVEARAMFRAWRAAGRDMARRPAVEQRWTRLCFCGQETSAGPSAADPQVGIPFLTGSEEERGPLFDVTGVPFEGRRSPVDSGPHGHKIFLPGASDLPSAVPLLAIRVGERLIVSIPAEGTKEVGARLRAAVGAAVAGSGIERVVVSGLANDFVLYLTTPEEYDRQHYEGGNTHYGTNSSVLVTEALADLAGRLARGEPAPAPAEFDPTNGVSPDGPEYGQGAADGEILEHPQRVVRRFDRVTLRWQGGPEGLDRPVGKAFVVAQRRRRGRWVRRDSDLGLAMLWKVDEGGVHDLQWEVPRHVRAGRWRLVVRAKRYRLVSRPFRVRPARLEAVAVEDVPAGRLGIALAYPQAVRDVDLTHRPKRAKLGRVRVRVGDRTVRARRLSARVATVRAPREGVRVVVRAGAARDRHGNRNATPLRLR